MSNGFPKKHAARSLDKFIRGNKLDKRGHVAKLLSRTVREIADDAGGLAHLSAREQILVERAAAATLICSAIENWLFQQPSVVTDKGELLPILRQGYVTHAGHLTRTLAALGLRPDRAGKLPDLSTYIAKHTSNSTQDAERAHRDDAAPTPAADSQPDPENPPQAAYARPTAISDED